MEPKKKPIVKLSTGSPHTTSIVNSCMWAANKAGWAVEEQRRVRNEMLMGDYDHVLRTAAKYFEVK